MSVGAGIRACTGAAGAEDPSTGSAGTGGDLVGSGVAGAGAGDSAAQNAAGAFARAAGATLPFTGLPLWLVALLGLLAVGTGMALRQRSRVHPART